MPQNSLDKNQRVFKGEIQLCLLNSKPEGIWSGIFNRPGVARAVLQIPSSLTDSVGHPL